MSLLIYHAMGNHPQSRVGRRHLDRWIDASRRHSQLLSPALTTTPADTFVHIKYIEKY